MVRKERVSVYIVELTLAWMWEAKVQTVVILGSVEANKIVEPFFNWIMVTISDWFIKRCFEQGTTTEVIITLA